MRLFIKLSLFFLIAQPLLSAPPLDIFQGWQRVCLFAPELNLESIDVELHEADICEASLYPNPELSLEVEDILGSRYFEGFDSAEISVALTQPIVTAGKISKRTAVAIAEKDISCWEYAIAKKNLREKFEHNFAKVALLNEKKNLLIKQYNLTKDTLKKTTELAENGKATIFHVKQASVALKRIELSLSSLEEEYEIAKLNLASMWGGRTCDIQEISYPFYQLNSPVCFDILERRLCLSEEVLQATSVLCAAKNLLASECAEQYPDVFLTGGYKHYKESSDYSLFFEVDVELPIFNRNQGGIQKANAEILKAEWQRTFAFQQLMADLKIAYNQFVAAYKQAKILREGLLKELEEIYALTLDAYNQGQLVYLDLHNSREALYSTQENYLNYLLAYHQSLSTIKRLTGVTPYKN